MGLISALGQTGFQINHNISCATQPLILLMLQAVRVSVREVPPLPGDDPPFHFAFKASLREVGIFLSDQTTHYCNFYYHEIIIDLLILAGFKILKFEPKCTIMPDD